MASFKFTRIEVDVVSPGDWEWDDLDDVAEAISSGPCSGQINEVSVKYLSAEQARENLLAHGSDPDLLPGLGDEGDG